MGAPAYAAFCDDHGLRDRLIQLLSTLDVDDTQALEEASARARELVNEEVMPDFLETQIREAYEALAADEPDLPVAVRSSATGEDTASASFAGMNETYLNIRGADAVVDAVRRCWASLFGSRTVFYRAKRGFGRPTWTSPSSSSAWSTPPARASCSRSTPRPARPTGSSSRARSASENPSCPEASRPTATWSRSSRWRSSSATCARRSSPSSPSTAAGRSPASCAPRSPSARCSPTRRRAPSPRWAGASSATTRARRTPSGRSTPTGACGCSSRARSPRPAARRSARPPSTRASSCCAASAPRRARPRAPCA